MDFELVGSIRRAETIAAGRKIRRLRPATSRLPPRELEEAKGPSDGPVLDGTVHLAEIHWYEAHGIGRREMKIKFLLLD